MNAAMLTKKSVFSFAQHRAAAALFSLQSTAQPSLGLAAVSTGDSLHPNNKAVLTYHAALLALLARMPACTYLCYFDSKKNIEMKKKTFSHSEQRM